MTIVDIAKEAGYSVSTVSRVLNGRRDVSEEARDRIMRIVEAYQFVPNNNAKHLKQTVSQSILILVKGTSNMLFTNIIEVIQDTIEGSDYSLRVHYLDEDADEVKEAVRMCRNISRWEFCSLEVIYSTFMKNLNWSMFRVCW